MWTCTSASFLVANGINELSVSVCVGDLKDYRASSLEEDRVLLDYIQSYVDGVNEFLGMEDYREMPFEFSLLGHSPSKWTLLDSFSIMRLMTWQMSRGNGHELTRSFLGKRLGKEYEYFDVEKEFREVSRHLPKGVEINFLPEIKESLQAPRADGLAGSNGWVVSGSMTKTGKPILSNDPHLPLSLPSIWYIMHLQAEDGLHVAGMTIPGMPCVAIGHNANIAWGVTLSFVDMADYFVEKVSKNNETYEFKGEQRKLIAHHHVIKVKGSEDVVFSSYETHHGPIMSDVEGIKEKISLQNAAFILPNVLKGFYGINFAKNWDDFTKSIAALSGLSLNINYADTEGNIGYQTSGTAPVRHVDSKKGTVMSEGWTGLNEWIGWVPSSEMPKALNPEQGFIVSANHRIVPDDYEHFLGECYLTGFRGKRIDTVLKSFKKDGRKLGVPDMIKLQLDARDDLAEQILTASLKQFSDDKTDADLTLGIGLLKKWDFEATVDSASCSVYSQFLREVLKHIFQPQFAKTGGEDPDMDMVLLRAGVPRPLLMKATDFVSREAPTVLFFLKNPEHQFVTEAGGLAVLLKKSVIDSIKYLKRHYGPGPESWKWGEVHQAQIVHALGHETPLSKVFNYGPFEIGGSDHTVLHTGSTLYGGKHHALGFLPSARLLVDMNNLDKSMLVIPPGQSGNPASEHFDDMFVPYISGKGYPFLHFSKAAVRMNGRYSITLATR